MIQFNILLRTLGGVTHTLSKLSDAYTADFTVVRALLARGRTYEMAVKAFEPYREIQEPNEGARRGMVQIAREARARTIPAFVFVNNRLEGNAPSTIEAVADEIGLGSPQPQR